jgi:hypothetical protein
MMSWMWFHLYLPLLDLVRPFILAVSVVLMAVFAVLLIQASSAGSAFLFGGAAFAFLLLGWKTLNRILDSNETEW